MDLIVKVKGFLSEPLNTFDILKEGSMDEAMKYYVPLAAFYSALSAVLSVIISSMFGPKVGFGIVGILLDAYSGMDIMLLNFVMSLILIFLWGAVLHIFVYIMNRSKDISRTIKAVLYGSTPGLLFGWIPIIGVIGFIWSSVLMIIGIRQFQELSTGRAITAVLVPIIIFFILVIAVLAMIIQFIIGMGFMG